MVFLLIVPSIMIVAIIFIHDTAEYFNLKISYISLAICAALSFWVDVMAAAISNSPGREYFLKLLGLIFVAAVIVTALNSYLTAENEDAQK